MSQVKTIKSILFLAIFIGGLFCFTSSADAIWYNASWLYRKKIVFSDTTTTTTLTNFPVAVILASSTNFDFSKARGDGFDVIFTKDDGNTLIDFERERYATTTGNAEFWVEIPSVATSTVASTTFYMYYGNSNASDISSSTAPWDANFVGVWHLKDDPDTSTVQESTINNYDGTKGSAANPNEVDGKIAKGQNYDAVTETIQMGDVLDFEYNQSFSVEAWGKHTATARVDMITSKMMAGAPYTGWMFWNFNNYIAFDLSSDNDPVLYIRLQGSTAINDNVWRHLSVTYNGNTLASGVELYVNGVVETKTVSQDTLGSNTTLNAVNLAIGNRDTPATNNQGWEGILDEVRVSNIVRSVAWIKASYNSGNNTLLTYGSEETPSVAVEPQMEIFLIE